MNSQDKPAYYDIHSGLWKEAWDKAKPVSEFLSSAPEDQAQRWSEAEERSPDLSEEQRARLSDYNRQVRLLVEAAPWCLDCARTVPYLRRIAESIGSGAEVRVIDRDALPALRDELRVLGAPRIPRVVVLSEDWFEVDRIGDRALGVYRSRMARETGRGADRGVLSPEARGRRWLSGSTDSSAPWSSFGQPRLSGRGTGTERNPAKSYPTLPVYLG